MRDRHDDREPLSPDEEAFARSVADLYAAPPLTASQRTRFDARLEERIRDGVVRRRPWFVGVAAAAAALSLLVWRAGIDVPDGGEVAGVEASEPPLDESETLAEEWILAMATDPPTETDEALPPDYVAISDLLLGD